MKKSILFASGIALAMSFAGCDDGSARITELQTQLDQAKQERDAQSLASQEQLNTLSTTYQYKVDSLQWIIDSLTAPKGTSGTKPKPKPSTPTTKTEEPKKDGKLDVGTEGGNKLDVGTNKTEEDKGNSKKLNVKP